MDEMKNNNELKNASHRQTQDQTNKTEVRLKNEKWQ